ncbi:MAG: hypothetical protein HY451_01200 [Parcubacteria group bacterium]|nr:hypothetical protein [Parcubacteria group bacterium]
MNIGGIITVVSLILIFLFLFLIVLFFLKAKKIKSGVAPERKEGVGVNLEELNQNWQDVLNHLNSANESEWKLAIIEADKLIDDLLIQKGYQGESLAERLNMVDKKSMKSFELLWEAHKVRNRIAHKLDFKINRSEALKVISYYGEALKDLEIL